VDRFYIHPAVACIPTGIFDHEPVAEVTRRTGPRHHSVVIRYTGIAKYRERFDIQSNAANLARRLTRTNKGAIP